MQKKNEQLLRVFRGDKFKVSPHKIPHYLRWISKYIAFSQNSPLKSDTVESFIGDIGARYLAWQTGQAEKAALIYLSFNRKEEEKHPRAKETLDGRPGRRSS